MSTTGSNALLLRLLYSPETTVLLIANEVVGEIQIEAVGPGLMDRIRVVFQSGQTLDLLQYVADITWWQNSPTLIQAVDVGWLSVPANQVPSGVVPSPSSSGPPVTGAGSAGGVAFWDSPSSITSDVSNFFYDDLTNRLGLGNATPVSTLSVGPMSEFQVGSTGNIVKINNVPTSFPSVQGGAASVLTNNGSGVLTWTPGGSGGMAIGGLITSATPGSVLFAGALGVLQQDNAAFFFDDTNNRLGIGTGAPTSSLHVVGSGSFGSALLVSNGAVAAPIAIFQDNGVDVLTIKDGGDLEMGGNFNWVPATDTQGKVGTAANRFAEVHAVTVTTGDFEMKSPHDNGASGHWKLIEDVDQILAINMLTGKRYYISMTPVPE